MAKQAYREPAYEEATVNYEDPRPVTVRIPNIRCVDPANDLYEIGGLVRRPIDWSHVFEAMGYPDYPGDQLADDIAAVVWKHDLIRALAERIEPA